MSSEEGASVPLTGGADNESAYRFEHGACPVICAVSARNSSASLRSAVQRAFREMNAAAAVAQRRCPVQGGWLPCNGICPACSEFRRLHQEWLDARSAADVFASWLSGLASISGHAHATEEDTAAVAVCQVPASVCIVHVSAEELVKLADETCDCN